MIKFLIPFSFLAVISAQAMDFDPRDGRYPLYQQGRMGAVKGNATLFQKDGKYVGVTSAHCVPYLLDSLSFLVTDEKKPDRVHSYTSHSVIDNIQIHPLYKGNEREVRKEDSKYDIALFTIQGNPNLKSFAGEFSTEDLDGHKDYVVDVKSFGPLFAKDGSSYEESIFHQLYSSLKFSDEGFFFHPFLARDFYLSFEPTQNGEYTLDGGLLSSPDEVNLHPGDSGSLAMTSDGRALAIASATGKDASKLLEIGDFPKEVLEIEKIDEEIKYSLLRKIQDKIATCTQLLKQPSGKEIFIFKLKEEFPSIEGNDYYTPLALHSEFINQYLDTITINSDKNRNEIKSITINKDADLYHDPDLAEQYLNLGLEAVSLSNIVNDSLSQMVPEDLTLLKKLFEENGWLWSHD